MSNSPAKLKPSLYHNAKMTERSRREGLVRILEAPRNMPRLAPDFVQDLSEASLTYQPSPIQNIHGSFLMHRQNALLFGPNNLVTRDGFWSCETRNNKGYVIPYMHADFYSRMFPGPKPLVEFDQLPTRLDTSKLRLKDVEVIEEPVFLATPLEPSIWGRWITTVLPKILHHRNHAPDRRFLCHAAAPWQHDFLKTAGLPAASLLPHDPGRTYICRDVMTVEFSDLDLNCSLAERAHLDKMSRGAEALPPGMSKIFVSRLSRSRANPDYRVLQNEAELAEALEAIGFVTVEPEQLSVAQQIALFAQADVVVCLGGSGLYNAAFCPRTALVVTIESSTNYIDTHAALLSSLKLHHGVIFGREDPADPSPSHKRWSLDVKNAVRAIDAFIG